MPKRLAAALGVVLVFAVVLVTVPLVSPEAVEAHDIYYWTDQKQQRCAFDPVTAASQCWAATVRVRVPSAHSHPQVCPTGTTGTYPDCSPILPTPVVPTTPTIPDLKDPMTTAPKTTKAPPPPTTTTPPTTTIYEPPECPPGYIGTPPNCKLPPPPKCPPGTTGVYPDCKTTPPTTPPKTTEPADCADGEHRHTLGARRNRGGGTTSACHDASASHCPAGQHEHVHGSQECHEATDKELKNNPCEDGLALDASWQSRRADSAGCFTMHCPAGQHEHVHGSRDCHPKNTGHDPKCPAGYFWNGSKCEKNPLNKIADAVVFTVGGDVVCTFVAGQIGAKAANLVVKNGSRLYNWFRGTVVEEYAIPLPCDELWDEYVESQKPPSTVDPTDDGDEADDSSDSDDTPKTAAEWDQAVKDAEEKWRRGELDGDELTRIQNERDCAKGHPWAQNCS